MMRAGERYGRLEKEVGWKEKRRKDRGIREGGSGGMGGIKGERNGENGE